MIGVHDRINKNAFLEECSHHPDGLEADDSGVLTLREVARELRCSKAHVCNLINGRVRNASPLPALSIGRRRLVRREALKNWIRASERTPE